MQQSLKEFLSDEHEVVSPAILRIITKNGFAGAMSSRKIQLQVHLHGIIKQNLASVEYAAIVLYSGFYT